MGLPQVSLYVRVTDAQGHRHYERLNRRTPQQGIYCLRYELTANTAGKPSAPISKPPARPCETGI